MGYLESKNNVVYNNHNCNPTAIIEQARYIYHTRFYIKKRKPWFSINIARQNQHSKRKKKNIKCWSPSPALNCIKCNTDASRIDTKRATTIKFVCRNNLGRIHYCWDVNRRLSNSSNKNHDDSGGDSNNVSNDVIKNCHRE